MKIVYIAAQEPVKKLTKNQELKEVAILLGRKLSNTLQGRRMADKIIEIELGSNWPAVTKADNTLRK